MRTYILATSSGSYPRNALLPCVFSQHPPEQWFGDLTRWTHFFEESVAACRYVGVSAEEARGSARGEECFGDAQGEEGCLKALMF